MVFSLFMLEMFASSCLSFCGFSSLVFHFLNVRLWLFSMAHLSAPEKYRDFN